MGFFRKVSRSETKLSLKNFEKVFDLRLTCFGVSAFVRALWSACIFLIKREVLVIMIKMAKVFKKL